MESIPTQLGRFAVESFLGKGAMGVVYKAHDPEIDRTVAIKLIRADLLDGESHERYIGRFRNEARAAGRCVHPNIVALYDFATYEGNPYLVMEYVDGVDLGRMFPRGTRSPEATVIRIALQVLDALGYAHGFGIIHRDVKPGNILLTKDGRLKVTDFGISRFGVDMTQSGVMVGTPSYMSPEQCRGLAIDGRSDLFSLGCVMYEIISGQRTFGGASYAETLYKLSHEPHVPLRDRGLGVSEGLSDVVDRALAKRPEDRFGSANDMATAIRLLLDGMTGGIAGMRGAGAADDPATIVLPVDGRSPAAAQPGSGSGSLLQSIDASSLSSLERQLAHYVGPMAGYHLRRALRDARSTAEFSKMLRELIPEGSQFQSLIRDALRAIGGGGGAPNATGPSVQAVDAITDDFAEATTRALTQVMGPIAPRLVARVRARAATRTDLVTLCAEMIEQPKERERFDALMQATHHA